VTIDAISADIGIAHSVSVRDQKMKQELHQAAVKALQDLLVDVIQSDGKDRFARAGRIIKLAHALQGESLNSVTDALNHARAYGNVVPQQLNIAGDGEFAFDPVPFNNGLNQGDNANMQRNILMTAQKYLEKGFGSGDKKDDLVDELSSLTTTKKMMEGASYLDGKRPKLKKSERERINKIDERIDFLLKTIAERNKTTEICKNGNSALVPTELARGYSSGVAGGGEDPSDGGEAVAARGERASRAPAPGAQVELDFPPVGYGG